MVQELTLHQLELKEKAHIVKIQGEAALQTRLEEIGFVPGAEISYVSKTPFGGPKAYQLKGTKIALRKNDTHHIVINRV